MLIAAIWERTPSVSPLGLNLFAILGGGHGAIPRHPARRGLADFGPDAAMGARRTGRGGRRTFVPGRHLRRADGLPGPPARDRLFQRLCGRHLCARGKAGGAIRPAPPVCARARDLRREDAILWLALPAVFPLVGRRAGADATETWRAFLTFAEYTRVHVLETGETGWHKIQSVFSVARMWGAPIPLAYAVQGAVTIVVAGALVCCGARRRPSPSRPQRCVSPLFWQRPIASTTT